MKEKSWACGSEPRRSAHIHEFAGSSLRWIPISGFAWSLYKYVASWRAIYGSSANTLNV